MANHSYAEYKDGYSQLLRTAKVKSGWSKTISHKAETIAKNKERYLAVSRNTGVPWEFIAVIHNLESSGSFNSHLHNGDSLSKRTTRVPRGYPKEHSGPFTWEESAIDALRLKKFDQEVDWSDEKVCYNLEKYNGFGYRRVQVNSPYLWSGTTAYNKGKYIVDGRYDPNHVSQQIGAIPLYKRLKEISVAEEKAKEKEKDKEAVQLLKENSRSYKALDAVTGFYKWVATGIAGLGVTEYLGWVNNFLMSWKGAMALGVILLGTWAVVSYAKSRKKDELKEGRYTPSGMTDAKLSGE